MAFVAIVAALAVLNLAAANPYPRAKVSCPRPALPEIKPIVVKSVLPAPANIMYNEPGVIAHESAPYEINYFGKPYIIKHKQSAALNVYTQKPVVVDEYAAPAFYEKEAAPAVIVEEVCPEPAYPSYPSYPAYQQPCY
ncbi:unnamed protein product [Bemisia tabaci]|uniref:Cuticular protein n=1 Tax=Bemisia tabaci TaxID=7038 RepID=A0A9P0EZZ5_BEMTA|nr:unnamed protein product [Bemisia tabaci]